MVQLAGHFSIIGDFFYKGLGGIQVTDHAPGFKQVTIRPSFDNDLEWVEAGYDSPYGWIRSHWRKEGDRIFMEMEVPPNTQAEIRLPAEKAGKINKDGKEISKDRLTLNKDKGGAYMGLVLDSGTHRMEFSN